MSAPPVWHGTEAEQGDLLTAVQHNCACPTDDEGQQTGVCPSHEALAHDQKWLDEMLFARRMRARWNREEHDK